MDLKEYIQRAGKDANKHGWKVTWEDLPAYLMATIDELTDGFNSGWRNDKKEKMYEEIGDCLIRLFHICYDLEIPIENILQRLMKENEKRSYKHGYIRI